MQRLLIHRLGSLGDTVVALPCFHRIAAAFPDHERLLVTNVVPSTKAAPVGMILEHSGLVHGHVSYPYQMRRLGDVWRSIADIRALGARELVYLCPRPSLATVRRDVLFFRLCGIRRVIGAPLTDDLLRNRVDPASGLVEPEAERLVRTLHALGAIDLDDPAVWDLRLTADEHRAAAAALAPLTGGRPVVSASIGARAIEKDWGDANWRALFERLAPTARGHALVMLGAEVEAERSEALLQHWQGERLNLCGRLSPRESAAVLDHVDMHLGHDSGSMHLAASRGVPCVVVFGNYNRPRMWFPYGPGHRVLHDARGVGHVQLDDVAAAAAEVLAAGARPRDADTMMSGRAD